MINLKKILIVISLVVITISACSTQSETTSVPSTPSNSPPSETTSIPETPSNSPQSETTRDLSSPSKIIVGHWRSPMGSPGGPLHFYFGNFDENGDARCFYNELFERELRPSTCHIFKEEGNTLWIKILSEDKMHFYQFPFTPAIDGQTMLFDDDNLFGYVDSNTEP